MMYRIEGSGGVTRNCWQLIIIPKYINRGHRTLKLQEPYCLDIGVATCGRPSCPGWQSHPCDLCREGWNMAPAAALTLRASAKTVALQLVCSEQECRVCKPVFSELLWTLYSTVSTTAASAPAFATLHHSDDWPDCDAGQSLDFRQKYIILFLIEYISFSFNVIIQIHLIFI